MIAAMLRHHYNLDFADLTLDQVHAYLDRIAFLVESSEEARVEARAKIRKAGRYG